MNKLEALRALMAERKISAYIIPTSDFHESEYVGAYFQAREYMSGFTGSAGTLLVTESEAFLWTDGRYFVQAKEELAGSGIKLMKMGEEGCPTLTAYLKEYMPEGGVLGFDGRVMNAAAGQIIFQTLAKKKITASVDCDLVGMLWKDRPPLSANPVWILDEKYAGVSAESKFETLRDTMKKAGAGCHVLTTLDDIAWLLNLRGNDVNCNPVFLSYLMIYMDRAILFVNKEILDETVKTYLAGLNIECRPYDAIYEEAEKTENTIILLEGGKVNYRLFGLLSGRGNRFINRMNPTSLSKAVKNPVEIDNERKAHIKDGVAVTKFMYWMKKNIGKIPMDELSCASYLEKLRMEQEGYIEPSFDTISAYGANAAMCHYSATKETNTPVLKKGLYLVDSGGQYYEGTTDITRTFVMGELTEKEREHFTLTVMSMLRLGDVKFLYGCSGMALDYVARELFWKRGLNFNHGTGHGVGYLLNVHERPNGFRWKAVSERQDQCPLEAGMITSDEPGIYIEGSHGIRTENLVVVKKAEKNEYGQFMMLEYLTFVPIDLDGLDLTLMEEKDLCLLNAYHRQVYEKISPYLSEEEKEWLKEYTRSVSRKDGKRS